MQTDEINDFFNDKFNDVFCKKTICLNNIFTKLLSFFAGFSTSKCWRIFSNICLWRLYIQTQITNKVQKNSLLLREQMSHYIVIQFKTLIYAKIIIAAFSVAKRLKLKFAAFRNTKNTRVVFEKQTMLLAPSILNKSILLTPFAFPASIAVLAFSWMILASRHTTTPLSRASKKLSPDTISESGHKKKKIRKFIFCWSTARSTNRPAMLTLESQNDL